MYVFRLTICHQKTSPSLLVSLACRQLFVQDFYHGLFSTHCGMFIDIILVSAHIWAVILVKFYRYSPCYYQKRQYYNKLPVSLILIIFLLPLPQCSLSLMCRSVLQIYPLGLGSMTLQFYWLCAAGRFIACNCPPTGAWSLTLYSQTLMWSLPLFSFPLVSICSFRLFESHLHPPFKKKILICKFFP